jgi:hypothetical protein
MITFLFLLKKIFDEAISLGSIGVIASIFITYEQCKTKLVARGVKDGMGEVSAIDSP